MVLYLCLHIQKLVFRVRCVRNCDFAVPIWSTSKKFMTTQIIGHDKDQPAASMPFFRILTGWNAHMKKHPELDAPKFQAGADILEEELTGLNIGSWDKSQGADI